MRANEFIKEAYVNPPNPEGPWRDRHSRTTYGSRAPEQVSSRWSGPDLSLYTMIPNTKIPKRKFREIVTTLELVPSKRENLDLEWGVQGSIYYHKPDNKDDIVAIAKGGGSGRSGANDLYMKADIWDSFN